MTVKLGQGDQLLLRAPTLLTSTDLPRARGLAKSSIRNCHACTLHTPDLSPVPLRCLGEAVFGVVGEAPGAKETELGKPFIGPSGKLLTAMLNEAGLDASAVAYMNAVSCWPRREDTGETRPPKPDEVQACRPNLMDQIVASGSRFFLLAGSSAVGAWRGDMKVTQVHGNTFVWMDRYIIMPIYHPSAILRDRSLRRPTMEDLGRWKQVVEDTVDPNEFIMGTCVRCQAPSTTWDRDAVGYCDQHWVKFGGTWVKERGKWHHADVDSIRTVQISLV